MFSVPEGGWFALVFIEKALVLPYGNVLDYHLMVLTWS